MLFGKLKGEAVGADETNGNGSVPQDACGSPACRHGIIIIDISCSDQHPVVIDQSEKIIRQFLRPAGVKQVFNHDKAVFVSKGNVFLPHLNSRERTWQGSNFIPIAIRMVFLLI